MEGIRWNGYWSGANGLWIRQGRERIFHGVNMVCKDKQAGYIGKWGRQDFEALRRMGFSLVRLGLIWDGLEPEPGKFDDAYLDKMEGLLDLCAEHGMYVMLDMHQDLYSVRYADGAPAWATLTDGLPEPEAGAVWSDAYLSSGAIQRAFDHFWANDPGPDGVGLQDHLSQCWQHVARRFGERPEVLGYDFLNEPFPGTAMLPIFGSLLGSFAQIEADVLGWEPRSVEEAAALFADKDSLFATLQLLDDPQRFAAIAGAAGEPSVAFDTQTLASFHTRMAAAIRQVTRHGILFMENNYSGNLGVPSGLQPIQANGAREPLQAFTPHGYDLVVDTPLVGSGASANRAGVIFANHRKTQQRLGMPVLVGEWGAFQEYDNIGLHCNFLLDTFDQYLWSFTYWHWHYGDTMANRLLTRPYPMAVSGRLTFFRFDAVAGKLMMEWENGPSCDAPTVISLPGGLAGRKVRLSPACGWEIVTHEGAVRLVITSGQGGVHGLTIE